jgi:NACalpha-BTF3-like transcription factor
LDAIKVNDDDVQICVNELQLSKPEAQRFLQKHNGDLQAALNAFLAS